QYTYTPGANNEDENGAPLPYGDQCDIYILLENRDGAKTKRVGTAWFRNGDTQSSWKEIEVPVKYGQLDPSDDWFDYAQPQPDEEWGTGTENVTHISVLFSSSFEGDFFKGAIGSVLEVDNLILTY
ncbi:MAG: PCMD domain-containing protein, partial [Schleiferiaceae bacterium]|nr:PCMD domain-containing protein [Schleiferiaceae bacterium]